MRRITLLALVAMLLAGCGNGSDGGGEVFDDPGAPYALTTPTSLDGVDFAPFDRGDVTGRAVYATKISPVDGTGPAAWVYAFPAGGGVADTPEQLGRRVWLASQDAGDDPGTIEARPLGGRPGFRFEVRGPDHPVEYRGAAVGDWVVVETCTSNDASGPATAACDALDRSLRLRDAPLPDLAQHDEELAPTRGGYRVKVPDGFVSASRTLTDGIAYTDHADAVSVMEGPWQNSISVEAFPRDANGDPPADSAAYCAQLAVQRPPTGHTTTAADARVGGRHAWGCRIAATVADAAVMMPDQEERRALVVAGDRYVEIVCASTAAQRSATDRACDQVLRTIQFDGAA